MVRCDGSARAVVSLTRDSTQPTICVIMTPSNKLRLPAGRRAHHCIACLFALFVLSYVALAAPPTLPAADPQRYLDDIKALTTPAMEGRGDGTKGLTRAQHLIEKRYKSLGSRACGLEFLPATFHRDHGRTAEREEHLHSHERQREAGVEGEAGFRSIQLFRLGRGARKHSVCRIRHHRRRVSLRRLRRPRCQRQDCRRDALRASIVCREGRESRPHAKCRN